jgi:hypothetical protein
VGWIDRSRAYTIVVDAVERGTIRAGQTVELSLEPGTHDIWLSIDWARSDVLKTMLHSGDQLVLQCWPRASPWTALYWITLGAKRYITLHRPR